MKKSHKVSDLFFTSWKDLQDRPRIHAEVYGLNLQIKQTDRAKPEYGYQLIAILRRLRKNLKLVDKINEVQAVDIFNDLTFLDEPWYHFPVRKIKAGKLNLVGPDEHMARHSFDHFIYADNEFTRSMTDGGSIHYIRRLAATLYKHQGETTLDRESVDDRVIDMKVQDWELQLIAATFGHIRGFITKRCKHLMPAPVKPEGQDEHQVQPTGPMWQTLKHRLAETPAFQGFDKAGSANIYDCLDYLEDLAKTQSRKNVNAA